MVVTPILYSIDIIMITGFGDVFAGAMPGITIVNVFFFSVRRSKGMLPAWTKVWSNIRLVLKGISF